MTGVEHLTSTKEWDEYVTRHPNATFFHLSGWKDIFERAFGFKTFYLRSTQNKKITGILPLVLVRTALGKNLFSVPIGPYAGALADSAEIATQLVSEAISLAKGHGCGYLQLRHLSSQPELEAAGFRLQERYVTFIKELPADPAKCLEVMPRKARAAARHAIDLGLTHETGPRLLDECFWLYSGNQRDLGSPTVSRDYFRLLAEVFKDRTTVLNVKKDSRTVASVLTFWFKDTILPFYGASARGSEKLNPNNYMYLKLQEYAVEKGLKHFDFGRSRKDAGSYHFKVNQGFEPRPLYYYYYLNKAKAVPEINPSNPLFELPKAVWKKTPLFITNRLGPALFKYVIP